MVDISNVQITYDSALNWIEGRVLWSIVKAMKEKDEIVGFRKSILGN